MLMTNIGSTSFQNLLFVMSAHHKLTHRLRCRISIFDKSIYILLSMTKKMVNKNIFLFDIGLVIQIKAIFLYLAWANLYWMFCHFAEGWRYILGNILEEKLCNSSYCLAKHALSWTNLFVRANWAGNSSKNDKRQESLKSCRQM